MTIIKFIASMLCCIFFISTCLMAYGLVNQSAHFFEGLASGILSGVILIALAEAFFKK